MLSVPQESQQLLLSKTVSQPTARLPDSGEGESFLGMFKEEEEEGVCMSGVESRVS